MNETETVEDVSGLAWNAAKFCGLVAQPFTPPIRLEWVDTNEEPARIEFYSTVRSTFNKRGGYLLVGLDFPKGGLADFFNECFDEFIRLQQNAKWRKLFNFAWDYLLFPRLPQCQAAKFSRHSAASRISASVNPGRRTVLICSARSSRRHARRL
ncbi:hypothetical protein J0H58_06285, partial [bacterium]|nr:hypothetical protein [bacterium]